ncbi:exo-alpha-sialidase [Acinetobacter baumannii]|uniref:exo-alpha-sialidase n=1 Tax=Acinetobacter baumannii TaxID=470 RepID=UPI003AF871D4
MTVPISDRLSQLYVGNGTNTRFDFTFRVFDQEDATGIAVRKKGSTEFETVDPSAYEVSINPDGMGGYVTFNSPPTVGTYFYIAGATPLDQLLDITNYDNFYPDAIERALDKLTALLQEWGTQLDLEKQSRILADIHYDSLAMEREENLENRLISYINSVVGITNPKIFDGISDRMVITKDGRTQREFNESIPFWNDDYVAFKQETIQREYKILDYTNSQLSGLNGALSAQIDDEKQRALTAEQDLQTQIDTSKNSIKYFSTEAELLAFVPTESDPKQAYAFDTKKNYMWVLKSGSTTQYEWKDEGRSTLALANDFSKALYQASTIKTSESDLYHFTASGGEVVAAITEEAILKIVGLDIDGKPISTILDEKNKELVNPIQAQDLYTLTDSSGEYAVWSLTDEGRPVGAKPFDLGVDALFAKATSNQEMTKIGLYHDYIKAKGKEAYNFNTTVYVKNDPSDGFTNEKTARMPSVIKISESRIFISWVVFDKLAPSDQSHGVMLGRFVDFDLKNKTATVNTNTVVMAGVRGSETAAYRHAAFTRVVNKTTGKIRYICLYNSGSFANKSIKVLKIYSDDNCQTWSAPEEIMDQNTHAVTALIPATIIKIPSGEFSGRLVVGAFGVNSAGTNYNIGVIVSDDNGATWNVGGTIASGAFDSPDVTYGFLNETSVCCDNSGELLLAIRNEGNSNINQRAVLFARSKDGGNTLYIDSDEPLIRSAVSEVALLQASDSLQTGIPKILLSFPSEPFASVDGYTRRALRIGFSYDNGKSYPLMYTPRSSDGVSGYSHMIALTDQDFVLVEEPTETIRVVFFNMAHVLTNGVLKND